MEPEKNENWSQPYENQTQPTQPDTYPQPEEKSFFQQECLQRTWLNVKLATWLKCLIVVVALFVAAVFIAPKFTSAQSQQQESPDYYSEFEDDWYDDYYDD